MISAEVTVGQGAKVTFDPKKVKADVIEKTISGIGYKATLDTQS